VYHVVTDVYDVAEKEMRWFFFISLKCFSKCRYICINFMHIFKESLTFIVNCQTKLKQIMYIRVRCITWIKFISLKCQSILQTNEGKWNWSECTPLLSKWL
jgi:hypothetical protein